MSQGIFQKLRTLTLSNIHSVLDFAIDLNSIGAIEQYVRDIEKAHDILDDQAAIHRSRVESLPGEVATLKAQYAEADENINILLGDSDPSNDRFATKLETKLVALEQQISFKGSELETAQTELAKFEDAASKLNIRKTEMDGRLTVLRQMEQTSKGRQRAEKLLSGVTVGDAPNVDNVEQRLREKAALSGHQLDRTLGRVTDGMGTTSTEATVAARLAKRRQALTQATEAK
jgi:phage shock protein A